MKQGMIDSHDDIPVLLIIILLFVLWMWFGLWHFHYHRDLPIPGSALDKFFREKEAEDEKERRILRSRFYLLSITIINSIPFLMCFHDIIIPGLIAFYEVIKVIPGSIAFYEEVILEFFHIKTFLHISEFAPISLYLVISLLLSLILIGVSFAFASSGSAYPDKLSAHERGFDPLDDARSRFDIRFYPVSILFIIFDSEVTFLSPRAVPPNKIGWFGFRSMMVFLWILTIGSLHEWKKGALDWE